MTIQTLLLKGINRYISKADSKAAIAVVESLKAEQPEATNEELVNQLVRRKCRQAGSIGAVTSGAAIIPGLGTVAAMTFGVAADIGMTFKLQAELVLEIAAVYGRELSENEKQKIILSITGISAGSQVALQKAGQQIAAKTTAQLAQKSIAKAIPFLGVAASGGTNIVTTYIIGRRAQAYFSLGPDQMEDWQDGLRAISGVNEKEIISWLGETTESSWNMISVGTKSAAESVIVTGKSTGTAVVVYSQKAAQAVVSSGGWLFNTAKDGAAYLWPFGSSSEQKQESVVDTDPAKSESDEGLLSRVTSWLPWSDSSDSQIKIESIDEDLLLEKLSNAELVDETVIGVVGAGDEINNEPMAENSYLQKISSLFTWQQKGDTEINKNKIENKIEEEMYRTDLPSTMVVVGGSNDDQDEGVFSKIISIFKRE